MMVSQDLFQEFSTATAELNHVKEKMQMTQEVVGSEGSGFQSTPSELAALDVDTERGATLGTITQGMQTAGPTIKITTPGVQTEPPSTQDTSSDTEPRSPGVKTIIPGAQPWSPSTWTSTPGLQTGPPSTEDATLKAEPGSPVVKSITPGTQTGAPSTWTSTPDMQTGPSGTQETTLKAEPGSPGMKIITLGTQPESLSLEATIPRMQDRAPSLSTTIHGVQSAHPWTQEEGAWVQPNSPNMDLSLLVPERDIDSALVRERSHSQVVQLGLLTASLKDQVAKIEDTKADKDDVQKLHLLLFPKGDQESVPHIVANIQGQVSSLDSSLQGQKEKMAQLEDGLEKLEVKVSSQITQQVSSMQQELSQELREQLDKSKVMLEQLVAKTTDQLQKQLDKLQAPVESMGQLLQRYERLQKLVESLKSQQAADKMEKQLTGKSQQDEGKPQVQRECEKLWRLLHDERQQRQHDLEALFHSVKRLQKEKASKEDLELAMDTRADKTTPADTISHSQLQASMRQLEERVQARLLSQNQDCLHCQEKLLEQMESKVDHQELGLLRQELEKRWKRILENEKDKMLQTEGDDAAGTKKPLTLLSCMSCDRPLRMQVPGPHQEALPSLPPLSPHLTRCPRTEPKPELTQQHVQRGPAAECKYPRVPRDCGGQSTLTHPQQRLPHFQILPYRTAWPVQPPSKQEELELVDQDGARNKVLLPPLATQHPVLRLPRVPAASCDQQQ